MDPNAGLRSEEKKHYGLLFKLFAQPDYTVPGDEPEPETNSCPAGCSHL